MRSAATVLGMALIGFLVCPITPPTDWPGHGLDGQARACTRTCDEVVSYHEAVETTDGFGLSYLYARMSWEEKQSALNRAKIDWVYHVNEECTGACDGFGPDPGCSVGCDDWDATEDAEEDRNFAYIAMQEAYDAWENADGITSVIWTVMANHSLAHGHDACDWTWVEPEW